jgi:hypothetical protein
LLTELQVGRVHCAAPPPCCSAPLILRCTVCLLLICVQRATDELEGKASTAELKLGAVEASSQRASKRLQQEVEVLKSHVQELQAADTGERTVCS